MCEKTQVSCAEGQKKKNKINHFSHSSAREPRSINTLEMPRQYFRAPLCLFPWSMYRVVTAGSENTPVIPSSRCSAAKLLPAAPPVLHQPDAWEGWTELPSTSSSPPKLGWESRAPHRSCSASFSILVTKCMGDCLCQRICKHVTSLESPTEINQTNYKVTAKRMLMRQQLISPAILNILNMK